MEQTKKLFKVEKWDEPEWGRSILEFTKYFYAYDKEVLRQLVEAKYGRSGWFKYDRSEIRYSIEEIVVEDITAKPSREDLDYGTD
jgi:hypothetical protein